MLTASNGSGINPPLELLVWVGYEAEYDEVADPDVASGFPGPRVRQKHNNTYDETLGLRPMAIAIVSSKSLFG